MPADTPTPTGPTTEPSSAPHGGTQHARGASLPNSCGSCDARWASPNAAHCAACHETFGAIGNFDRHRRDGQCRHPSELGMVQRRGGIWRVPMPLDVLYRNVPTADDEEPTDAA